MMSDHVRLGDAHEAPEDEIETSLRPRKLDDFIGQDAVREQLGVALDAAKARGEALDHVLLAGPPGSGRPPSQRSSRKSSARRSCSPPAPRWSAREMLPRC